MENEDKSQKRYEMSFLVGNESDVPEVLAVIRKFNGAVTKEPSIRRIALAYKIKKQTSAVFGFLHFHMSPEDVKALEHDLRTAAFLLRSLILALPRLEERAAAEKPRTYRPVPSSTGSGPSSGGKAAYERKPAAPALSNEALERKIEEILQ